MKFLQSKNQFLLMRDWKSYCLHHIILTIAHKNLILETTRILQIQCFFSKLTSKLKVLFLSGKLKFSWANRHLITFARRPSCKKVNFDPWYYFNTLFFFFQPYTAYSRPAQCPTFLFVRATIAGEKLLRASSIFTKSFYQEIQAFF